MKKKWIVFMYAVMLMLMCSRAEERGDQEHAAELSIQGIELYAEAYTLKVNDSLQLTALMLKNDGTREELAGKCVGWQSHAVTLATVNDEGVVTAHNAGTCEIEAAYQSYNVSVVITIEEMCTYDSLLISEVLYDAEGKDTGKEFIELYNADEQDHDVSACVLVDGSESSVPFVFPEGTRIQGKDYLVVAQDREQFYVMFSLEPDLTSFSYTLNNNGETVSLYAPDASLIDRLYIEGGSDQFPAGTDWGSTTEPSSLEGMSIQRDLTLPDSNSCNDWYMAESTPSY